MSTHFYDLEAKTFQQKTIKLDAYKGKVVLVVNTASKCGFTPQYAGLEELYKKYMNKGFEILGFPSNQFANQEPGTAKEIQEGCLINYGVTFQMFDKIDVNGSNTHPIFKFLKTELPGTFGKKIQWNFTKFLIDRNGQPVKRYAPITKPEKIENEILKLL